MTDAVEAVAKAIYASDDDLDYPTTWPTPAGATKAMYELNAKAAIDAHKQWLEDNGKVIVDVDVLKAFVGGR